MARMVEGNLTAKGFAFGTRGQPLSTSFITARLLDGALDALRRHGADEDKITVVRVPGSFEIPLVAKRMAASRQYDAVICLGTVIRGATPHFDYIAQRVWPRGWPWPGWRPRVYPSLSELLTTDSIEQAVASAPAPRRATRDSMPPVRGNRSRWQICFGN